MTSLCIDCGLCCDGTMYATVEVVEADGPSTLEAQGFRIRAQGEKRLFAQACVAFRGGACAVYEQRPGCCRRYRCALLRQHEAGAISTADAKARIAETLAARDRVRPGLLEVTQADRSLATATLIRRLDAMLAPLDVAARQGYARLLLDVGLLRVLLRQHFESRDLALGGTLLGTDEPLAP